MGQRKNIFTIGRQGHRGDENQLTEMLAYLFQEERALIPAWLRSLDLPVEDNWVWEVETQRAVPGGFLDLVLFARGAALVVVESKLGSTTDFSQISKYLAYAKGVRLTGPKALVFTTQSPEQWPNGIENEAKGVELIIRRWQAVDDFLRGTGNRLAQEFAEMLEDEGLAKPNALTQDDWATWQQGYRVGRHLKTLLDEAGSDLQGVAPGFKKIGSVTFASTGAIYRSLEFDGLSLYVGFWPTRKAKDPEDHALITVYVLNTEVPLNDRKAAGQAAVERAARSNVAMSGWGEAHVVRTTPTHEVLTAIDFDEQCRQFVEEVVEGIEYFRSLEYLPPLAVSTTSN